jgi:N-methylhydantoinase A
MAPVGEASRLAAGTVLSGPAGGISGSRRCADLLHLPDLVPFDMGGTSTDISLIAGGQASLSADGMLAGQRIALRSLDIASIAAGGGSIASVDAGRTLRVGPRAPARSRVRPATTMAARPPPSPTPMSCSAISMRPPSWEASARSTRRLGSRRRTHRGSAGLSRLEAAAGIYKMINLKMADGIRLMTLRRGVDPRKFALLSFGGAALHAAEVARAGDQAHHRADGRVRAIGLGHADQRSPLRGQPHALRRRPHFAREVRELFAGLERRLPAGCAPGSTGPSPSSVRPRCAMANRFLRSTCR